MTFKPGTADDDTRNASGYVPTAETETVPQGYVEHEHESWWDNDGKKTPCHDCVGNDLFNLFAREACSGLSTDQLQAAGEGAVLELLETARYLEAEENRWLGADPKRWPDQPCGCGSDLGPAPIYCDAHSPVVRLLAALRRWGSWQPE